VQGKPRVNDDLADVGDVRVIDEHGQMVGVMPVGRALELARDRALDLIEVTRDAAPPTCKIMKFAKFTWSDARAAHERRSN
jgi:translation initiation factor IF-3